MKAYMRNTIKLFIIISIIIMSLTIMVGATEIDNSIDSSSDYDVGAFRDLAYYRTLKKWNSLGLYPIDIEEKSFDVSTIQNKDLNPLLTFTIFEDKEVALVNKDECLKLAINVEEEGLYEIGFMYHLVNSFTSYPYVSIEVNDVNQFNEAKEVPLEVSWSIRERNESERYNRYGNELLPYSDSVNEWYKNYIDDNTARYSLPFKFHLIEGTNIISITPQSYDMYISNIYINNTKELKSYEEYIANYQNYDLCSYDKAIQSENFEYKNDIEVKASYYKDPAMTPNAYKSTVLNMMDGASSSRGGISYTYEVKVDKSGLYPITFKYLQDKLKGLSAMKSIYINGVIPYKELEAYAFPEANRWTNHTLSDSQGNPYYVYLEEGVTNTIKIESSTVLYNDYIEELYEIMDAVSNLGLKIASITGSSSSGTTDWNIVKYIPTLVDDLNNYASRVDRVYDAINDMNPKSKEASEISVLQVASKQLKRLTKRPNKIYLKLEQLNSGSGSAYQLIGTAIGTLLNQPVSFDCFYLSNSSNVVMKAKSNIFARMWFSFKSFIYSFFDTRYKFAADNNDDILEVWVGQSSLYLDIIQNMIDTEFTKDTGIEVKASILSTSQKIVLNNATKTNPDVILSIDSWEPYNYALRGILKNLKEYDDFDDVTSKIYANCFTPVIYEDGVYAIPETQGLYLLFYRKDILNYLGITAPDTWDDVLKILPILQSYQMNFYHPLGSDSSYKAFASTTPFIYSFGAEVFSDNGLTSSLTSEEMVNAITYMTDLFNIYNLPQQVSSFFEHFRSGTLPIGVGTIDMYLQLKYASPELTGQWGIVPVPGFDTNNDGEVERWTTAYGKSSIIFESTNMPEEAWKFVSWWNSTDVQIEYTQNIKMCLGEKYLVIPANVDALALSPWDQEIKTQVTNAAKWSRIPAVIPGSYVVERELSNIWNKIVVGSKNIFNQSSGNRMDVRVAISESVDKVNRELERKYTEFGYVKDSKLVKNYKVPNASNIHDWVKGYGYEE